MSAERVEGAEDASSETPALSRRELREREAAAALKSSRATASPRAVKPRPVSVPGRSERVLTERAGRASTRPPARRELRGAVVRKSLSFGAMLFATALLIGMSVPATLFAPQMIGAGTSGDAAHADVLAAAPAAAAAVPQSIEVAADALIAEPVRENYTVTSYAEQLRERYSARSYGFAATSGSVRWPFPFTVPVTDGWGERIAPCGGCSTFHKGVDFTPGGGSPIYSIADGVVSFTEDSNSGLGNHVYIDHLVNGQKVTSVYAHMQAGSSPLAVGDVVPVGGFIGLVGNTGASVGAHLHLEILLDGVHVDPFAWLETNAVN